LSAGERGARAGASPSVATLLRVDDLHEGDGGWEGSIGEQRLRLPQGVFERGGSAHVRLLPEDVRLVWNEEVPSDQRSRLHGVVRDVVLLPEGRLVAVDVGQVVWVRLSPEEVELLRVERGQAVTCLVKTDALSAVLHGR